MEVFGLARNSVYRFRQRLFPTSMVTYPFHFAMLTHPGRVRKGNEDTCAASIESGAFVVCDGMGGAAAGEVASRMAADTFLKTLAPKKSRTPRNVEAAARLDSAIHAANQAVFQHSRRSAELRGMGTTLVALLFEAAPDEESQPSLTLAHVGDSRCYRFRNGELELLTGDHSLVEEQVRSGELTPFQAQHHPWRNIITRAVGSQATVEAEIQTLAPQPGDLYLLASDGLTRELADEEIAEVLVLAHAREPIPSVARLGSGSMRVAEVVRPAERTPDLAIVCQSLIDRANDAGGGDNITVLLLGIK
jgi:protein phosphatase